MPVDVTAVGTDEVFRLYSTCKDDPHTWVLDVRPQKDFKKSHLVLAYSIRLTADEKALLDYSKNQYALKWSPGCWFGKHVFVYGEAGLKKDHPVLEFFRRDGRAARVTFFKEGIDAIARAYPFLITSSIKGNVTKRSYPSELVPSLLYLGDWDHACDEQQLEALNIRGILTIHNHPNNLRTRSHMKHLKIEAPDVDSHDISQHFAQSFDFIEEARAGQYGVLVHCGAGVSRSATLCAAYLMRRRLWTCQQAMMHLVQCRSIVEPNEGFIACLRAMESALGIGGGALKKGFDESMAGEKVVVREVSEKGGSVGGKERRDGGREKERHEHRERERERDRERDRGREDGRDRERDRDRRKEGNRERGGRRDERVREGDRDGKRERERMRERSPEGVEGSAGEAAAEVEEPAVVMEVLKDGKVVSKLEIQELKPNQRCIFGRAPTCDVVLEHLSISRQHAQLSRDDTGSLSLTDLNTSHGTNVNDAWLRPSTAKQLGVGSVVKFGASTRSYRVAALKEGSKRQRVS